jgi:hypothetical protein
MTRVAHPRMHRRMVMTRMLTACAGALLAAACSTSPTAPDGAFHTEVTLRPGVATAIASTPLNVMFQRVANDSRCPANALCITSGDALVALWVGVEGRGATDITLRTVGGTTGENLAAEVAGYTLTISGLQPYPLNFDPIPQGDYRVTVRVSRD